MQFFSTLLIGASALASFVAAQSLPTGTVSTTLFFSNAEAITAAQAGEAVTLEYQAPSDAPVTITLVRGPTNQLEVVEILTTSATGGSYDFTPEDTLEDGSGYAFLIQQGSEFNYSGQFTLSGGAIASSIASAASTAASSAASAASSLSESLSSLITATSADATSTPAASAGNSSISSSVRSTGAAPTGPTSSGANAPANTGAASSLQKPAALIVGALAAVAFF